MKILYKKGNSQDKRLFLTFDDGPNAYVTPRILDLLDDLKSGVPVARISAKFHNTMSEIIVAIAQLANEKKVALSGGCFQNKYLTERTIVHLIKAGFQLYWHQRIPPNDGGISLGQAVAVIDLKNRAR